MKVLKLLLVSLFVCFSASSFAVGHLGELLNNPKAKTRLERKAAQAASTARMVDSLLVVHSFTFVAERAVTSLPNMPYITLNSGFSFVVDSAQIVSSLPFYGNMYQAPLNGSDSPLSFTSTDFQYAVRGVAKGREKAYISINVIVGGMSYDISMEVFDNAITMVTIGMSNGSTSTFYGYIEPTKTK